MALIDPNDIFFTPFEPKLKNRFIMQIDGIPAFLVKTMARPAVQFESVTLDHINVKRYVKGKATWQPINVTGITYLDLTADATAVNMTNGVGTIRFGLSSTQGDSTNLAAYETHVTGSTTYTQSPNATIDIFDIQGPDGNAYVEWTAEDTGVKTIDKVDVRDYDVVYVMVTSFMTFTGGSATVTTTNFIDDLGVFSSIENLSSPAGNELESSTWKNYKSITPSENNNDDYEDGNLDIIMQKNKTIEFLIISKYITHWFIYCLPLLVILPVLSFLFYLDYLETVQIFINLFLGSFGMVFIANFVSALTLGARRTIFLKAIIMIPLFVPFIIFGSDAGSWPILLALSMLSFVISIYVTAYGLRLYGE